MCPLWTFGRAVRRVLGMPPERFGLRRFVVSLGRARCERQGVGTTITTMPGRRRSCGGGLGLAPSPAQVRKATAAARAVATALTAALVRRGSVEAGECRWKWRSNNEGAQGQPRTADRNAHRGSFRVQDLLDKPCREGGRRIAPYTRRKTDARAADVTCRGVVMAARKSTYGHPVRSRARDRIAAGMNGHNSGELRSLRGGGRA
jgi:hypothetical protein